MRRPMTSCGLLLMGGALLLAAAPCLAGVTSNAKSGQPTVTWTAPSPPPTHAIDAFGLEAWMNWWFDKNLADERTGAPGAVVAVVQDGQVILVKGYGYADLATRRAMRPDTVVRIGSVSKPVTATAVMQLIEAGRLDSRRPVNDYLEDFQVPVAFGRPITVLDLVTHTAGFDVRLEGTAASSDGGVRPLGEYLRRSLPAQVRESGRVLAYSNHGYTLLGHLVEQVTGQRFEDYAADHIFQPLGMRRSGYRLTPELARAAATGYEPSPQGFRPSAPIHPQIYPAAGLNSTAEDMAMFIIAQLNGGAAGSARILLDRSVEEMHRQQFTMSPAMPGMAFGFFEITTASEPALAHGGGIRGFISGLCLWPRHRLGLFVSNNGYSAALVRKLMVAFAERQFAAKGARTSGEADDRPRRRGQDYPDALPLDRFAGAYRLASQAQGNIEKAGALRGRDLEITVSPHWRRLLVDGATFEQIGKLQFRDPDRGEIVAFCQDGAGRVTYLLTTDPFHGNQAWERLPWYRASGLHRELFAVFCLAFISVFLVPYRWLARIDRSESRPRPSPPAGSRWARTWLAVVAGLDLAFVVVLAIAFRNQQATGLLYGIPPLARFDLALSGLAALLALALPVLAWRAWREEYWTFLARAHYSFCAIAAVGFAGFLAYWHVLGY